MGPAGDRLRRKHRRQPWVIYAALLAVGFGMGGLVFWAGTQTVRVPGERVGDGQARQQENRPVKQHAQAAEPGIIERAISGIAGDSDRGTVERWLADNLDDREGLEIVTWKPLGPLAGCTVQGIAMDEPGRCYFTKYRSRNAFGALTLSEWVFVIDGEEVKYALPSKNFRLPDFSIPKG